MEVRKINATTIIITMSMIAHVQAASNGVACRGLLGRAGGGDYAHGGVAERARRAGRRVPAYADSLLIASVGPT